MGVQSAPLSCVSSRVLLHPTLKSKPIPLYHVATPGKKQMDPSKKNSLLSRPGDHYTPEPLALADASIPPNQLDSHLTCLNDGIFLLRGSCLYDLTGKVTLRGISYLR